MMETEEKMKCEQYTSSVKQNDSSILIADNRCHEPQIAVVFVGFPVFDQLNELQRSYVSNHMLNIWDIYKPISVDTNCGLTEKDKNLHWKFNYDVPGYKQLLSEIIKNENDCKNKPIIENHLVHFTKMHEKWLKTKRIEQLEQIEGDIDLYQQLFGRGNRELPTRTQLIQYIQVQFDQNIIWNHKKNLRPDRTSLTIEIPTNEKKESFKMRNYDIQIFDALEIFIELMNNTKIGILQYLSSITEETDKYIQAIKWFELKVTTNKAKKQNKNVIIMVHCQCTILRYILMVLYIFKHDVVEKWSDDYIKFIENELKKQDKAHEAVSCDQRHYELLYQYDSKKLRDYKYIGVGSANKGIITQRFRKRNEDITESKNKQNYNNCNNNKECMMSNEYFKENFKGSGWTSFQNKNRYLQ